MKKNSLYSFIFSLFFGIILLSSNATVSYSQEGTFPDWVDKEGAVGIGITTELSYAEKKFLEQKESLKKEKIRLDKEQVKLDQDTETLKQQIFGLSLTIEQMKTNNVSLDKIEDLEEQLTELHYDQIDLKDSQVYLQERQDAYEKNWRIIQASPYFETLNVISEPASIPPWFKSNAKWWKEGLISDGDIINALESLIIQNIIPLDNFVKKSSGIEHVAGVSKGGTFTIPSYQKDVFGYWSDGQVSDNEIVTSIGFLMNEGIIDSEKISEKKKSIESNLRYNFGDLEEVNIVEGHDKMTGGADIETVTKSGNNGGSYFTNDDLRSDNRYDFSDEADDLHQNHVGEDNYTVYLDGYKIEILKCTHSDCSESISEKSSEPTISGGMEQLIPVSAFNIGGQQYPISQFTLWKWTGECNDVWHYHTNTGHAVSFDSLTGIPDPDQENCGFGKVGEIFVGTAFLSQDQIDKFRKLTGYDPLVNEAMMGGSDTGNNAETEGSNKSSLEEDEATGTSNKSHKPLPGDSDGDGIADEIDANPNQYSDELSIDNGEGLPAKIIFRGENTIKITSGVDGTLMIEVGSDGGSDPVIIEIMGVELEVEPGTIFEANFG